MTLTSAKMALSTLTIGALAAALAFTPARSATFFEVDYDSSSVSISQSGGGVLCSVTACGIGAAKAPGLATSFSLELNETKTFDFIAWTAHGTTGRPRNFDVSATLAFSQPGGSATGTGSGFAFMIGGVFTAGGLSWNNGVPAVVSLGDTVFSIDFEDGLTILPLVGQIITHASVTLLSEPNPNSGPVATPLPLTAPLFGAGLGFLGFLSWRRKQKDLRA